LQNRELKNVAVTKINEDDYKMRESIGGPAFDELVSSVMRDGLLVPILLRRVEDGYTIVAGHRRFAAVTKIGWHFIPAQILGPEEEIGWGGAFAENMFRQDLTPLEEAAAVQDCVENGAYTIETLSRALGRSTNWIVDRLDMMKWPDDVLAVVHSGALSVSASRNLAGIDDDVHRAMLLEYAVSNGATARITAAWLQSFQAGKIVDQPGDVEPVPANSVLPPIEPYTPCIMCGRKFKMVELRYTPICTDCSPLLVDLASKIGAAGGEPAG
jgi:ParB family chromosome partitioning protein